MPSENISTEPKTKKPRIDSNGNGACSKHPVTIAETDDNVIDLRTDEVTLPNQEMRNRMANAKVGNDAMGEDPTVKELEKRIAHILGKEAALLVPSGTMGNLISVLVHCPARGSEVIIGDKAHTFLLEQGGLAQFGGVLANKMKTNPDGTFSIDEVKQSLKIQDDHYTNISLICLENTHMACGGRAVPQDWIDEITKLARDHGILVHMDGARLFNAAIANGIPASRIVRDVTSVSVCLSKGLGAPVGALLVGDANFITKSKRVRQALGGGMCQSGIIAAAGLYALDNMIDRLGMDHLYAKQVAEAVVELKSVNVDVDAYAVETNIMFLHVYNGLAEEICKRFAEVTEKEKLELGESTRVKASVWPGSRIRLVLHSDISGEMVSRAIRKICYVISEYNDCGDVMKREHIATKDSRLLAI